MGSLVLSSPTCEKSRNQTAGHHTLHISSGIKSKIAHTPPNNLELVTEIRLPVIRVMPCVVDKHRAGHWGRCSGRDDKADVAGRGQKPPPPTGERAGRGTQGAPHRHTTPNPGWRKLCKTNDLSSSTHKLQRKRKKSTD